MINNNKINNKICLASDPYLKRKCNSNPELNPYIKKPKFSRDLYDYDVSRKGYSPRKLVCKEIHTASKSTQAWLTSVLVMILVNPFTTISFTPSVDTLLDDFFGFSGQNFQILTLAFVYRYKIRKKFLFD